MMNKANVFVVGAMKAGTTSFVDMLLGHEEIYLSPIKEPHYFVNELPFNLYSPSKYFSLEDYFTSKFPEPLHIANVTSEEDYEKLFSLAAEEKCLLDASTAYLHAPESPELIKSYNEHAKIIILLRDPMKRAYSHYGMDVGLGRTTQSFEAIIKEEIALYKAGNLKWNSYLGMSCYTKQVAMYQSLFKEVLVVRFENLIASKDDVVVRVSEFLEIDLLNTENATHKNETRIPRFAGIVHILTKLGLKDIFSKLFGSSFKQNVYKLISKKKTGSIPLSNEVKDELEQLFKLES